MMSLHGISKDAWKRYSSEGSWYYEIVAPGFKYNLTDVAAALGRVQLQRGEAFWRRRKAIAARYTEAFAGLPGIRTPVCSDDVKHAWHLYVIRVVEKELTLNRDGFVDALKAEQIGTSVHFIPLHRHPYYRTTYGYAPGDFPVASSAYQRILSLPIYSKMSDADIDDVIDAVTRIVQQHRSTGAVGAFQPVETRAAS
jgi:dTDP-4-amino-4,6-dideoxygalactose transaminase